LAQDPFSVEGRRKQSKIFSWAKLVEKADVRDKLMVVKRLFFLIVDRKFLGYEQGID